VSFDGDDFREMREANQKHRWTQYEQNVAHAQRLGVEYIEKASTWFFSLPNGKKVHFYPTKNTWRIVPSKKHRAYKGGFVKFWKWFIDFSKTLKEAAQ